MATMAHALQQVRVIGVDVGDPDAFVGDVQSCVERNLDRIDAVVRMPAGEPDNLGMYVAAADHGVGVPLVDRRTAEHRDGRQVRPLLIVGHVVVHVMSGAPISLLERNCRYKDDPHNRPK